MRRRTHYIHAIKVLLTVMLLLNLVACYEQKKIRVKDWYLADQAVIATYRSTAQQRFLPYFKYTHVSYPPRRIALITFKAEQVIELWAQGKWQWRRIKSYPLTATSGHPGPKLKALDRQIPEGIYRIQFLHPLSHYHLAMRINYPNAYDHFRAKLDGRKRLGGDIFIHGKNLSAGCLAVGDQAIEELYVLVHDVGVKNVKVIIASNDFCRANPLNMLIPHPPWTFDLNHRIRRALQSLRPMC
jgi:murein L,D-transpeptidase YafK